VMRGGGSTERVGAAEAWMGLDRPLALWMLGEGEIKR